jgi:hypothetical protein
MHSCPVGIVVGVHISKNLLLCSAEFGDYGEEIVQQGSVDNVETQSHGMHACEEGMGVTGLHANQNRLACARLGPRIPRFVDRGTQRAGMHACPEIIPLSGIHVRTNRLLCGTQFRLRILSFTAEPSERIPLGETPTLRWDVDCTAPDCKVFLKGGGLNLSALPHSGSKRVTPDQDTQYTLTAESAGGADSKSAVVRVEAPKRDRFFFQVICRSGIDPMLHHCSIAESIAQTLEAGRSEVQRLNGNCEVAQIDPGAVRSACQHYWFKAVCSGGGSPTCTTTHSVGVSQSAAQQDVGRFFQGCEITPIRSAESSSACSR